MIVVQEPLGDHGELRYVLTLCDESDDALRESARAVIARDSLFPALSASCGPEGCTGMAKVTF